MIPGGIEQITSQKHMLQNFRGGVALLLHLEASVALHQPPPSCRFWTPPHGNLPPGNPPRTPPSQVLTLRDESLVNRAGEQGDAVPAHLIAKVLASHTDL
jgi:hypothetical protein